MMRVRRFFLALGALALAVMLAGLATGRPGIWQPGAVAAAVAVAVGLAAVPALKGYQFTGWIIAAVTAPMLYPAAFLRVGDFDLRNKWLILVVVQLVMFGMGTQIEPAGFQRLG
jgi:BASS family bile acid:Na+ symporter